uniref:Fibronectin type-III domain-containing protein n=1 Tax=Timema shepardi TaxID=629360 RepID=A0A7R9AXR0_TIMSH|nr:unnamed protein product [Timema shepardi]
MLDSLITVEYLEEGKVCGSIHDCDEPHGLDFVGGYGITVILSKVALVNPTPFIFIAVQTNLESFLQCRDTIRNYEGRQDRERIDKRNSRTKEGGREKLSWSTTRFVGVPPVSTSKLSSTSFLQESQIREHEDQPLVNSFIELHMWEKRISRHPKDVTIEELTHGQSSTVTMLPTRNTSLNYWFITRHGGRYRFSVRTGNAHSNSSRVVEYTAPIILPPGQVQVLPEKNGSYFVYWKETKLPDALQGKKFQYVVMVSPGRSINMSAIKEYRANNPPIILNNMNSDTIYSVAVVLETEEGFRSLLSEVESVEVQAGWRFHPVALTDARIGTLRLYLTTMQYDLRASLGRIERGVNQNNTTPVV